jgi:hypothetical protein
VIRQCSLEYFGDDGLPGAHCVAGVVEEVIEEVHTLIMQPHVNMRSIGYCWLMDIADVRDRTGLSAAALHHYEKLGLIVSTERIGLRRQYDDEVIEVLSVIALCQRSGFTLGEIGFSEEKAGLNRRANQFVGASPQRTPPCA